MAKKKKLKRAKKIAKPKQARGFVNKEISNGARKSKIRIIGIGGGGGSIAQELAMKIKRVSFTVANTDIQALKQAPSKVQRFQFGWELTQGLGCGMNPNLGRLAAQKEKEKIHKLFKGVDLCILVSCLGGGTGSGATPIFAEILKEMKPSPNTLGVFTLPFGFEGEKKLQIARTALEKLSPCLNALTVFPNEKIFQIIDRETPLKDAFSSINKTLAEAIEGLVEMIYLPGLINIDFADLRMILGGEGKIAYLNSVKTTGPNRAEEAVKKVLYNPLSEYNIRQGESAGSSCFRLIPERILFNITASKDLKMKEVEQISKTISNYNRQAKIIFGVSHDKNYADKLRLTLLATGEKEIEEKPKKKIKKPKARDKISNDANPQIVLSKKEIAKETAKENNSKEKPKEQPKKKALLVLPLKKARAKQPLVHKAGVPRPAEQFNKNNDAKIRKNALDIRKETEQVEKELWIQEKKWDTPAFLRRKNYNPNTTN